MLGQEIPTTTTHTTILEKDFIELRKKWKAGVTEKVELMNHKVLLKSGEVISQEEYHEQRDPLALIKAQFKIFEQKWENVDPTLTSYKTAVQPDPEKFVIDKNREIDDVNVHRELSLLTAAMIREREDPVNNFTSPLRPYLNSTDKIPDIVHFISFGCRQFRIHHYLSFLSVIFQQNPESILLHTNCESGYLDESGYWNSVQMIAGEKLKMIHMDPPLEIFSHQINVVEHQSDVARLYVLLRYGGIYLDDDVILLKSLNRLIDENEFIIGEENYDALANSILMSSNNAWFLKKWFQEYKYFNDDIWSHHSCFVPWGLAKLFPDTVSVQRENLLRPNWEELYLTFKKKYDWSNNYAIHLYARYLTQVDKFDGDRTIEEFLHLDTTYGEIARYTLFGDKRLVNEDFNLEKELKKLHLEKF